MTIDTKIKQTTLKIGLQHYLQDTNQSKERLGRNILEFYETLLKKPLSENLRKNFYNELLPLLENPEISNIYLWIIKNFPF